MKTIRLETEVKAYAYDELSDEDRRLVDEAKRMTATSYAPYSRFHVGAAICTNDRYQPPRKPAASQAFLWSRHK